MNDPMILTYVTLPSRRHAGTPTAHLAVTVRGYVAATTMCGWTATYGSPVKGEPVKVCTACESAVVGLTFMIEVMA